MSKSTGNLISLRDALRLSSPGGLRWYLLSTPYRVRLEWNARALGQADREYRLLGELLARWLTPGRGGRLGASVVAGLAEDARADLSEGLATDRVIDRLRELSSRLSRDASERVARGERPAAIAALRAIEERIGLPLTPSAIVRSGRRSG